ncbi:multidrug efflux RND transporter permease subunit [Tamlana fucoidanivorans]|uniref:Multidrug efflux RND transporter permease subunit n=1 Tax=Allotamlana fucoidanivorans TaxID=2583814 RepID=A0A5C4SDE1_9FLAO|nr:multidrug efflux RND transporter permease subunit [Tamlana fucoidanivorans]TNJ41255.1 multidrug efflux RND transporter permease subunit [Tamlana fucoidanivorans]
MRLGVFIDRPILSIVISILIVLLGAISIVILPIEQYPQITPPLVKVTASYPGAGSVTVAQAIATPIEQELNGTPGMIYMESTSSNSGSLTINVTFDVGTDPEIAAVDIQNRVKLAESRLPAEVIQNGIKIERQAASQLLTLSLTSSDEKFDEIYLSNYATINILDVLRRVPGVGRVSNIGSRYYSMRVWLYPDAMAGFGLTVNDVRDAILDQNRESAAGELGLQPITSTDITVPLITSGRLEKVEEFENVIVRAKSNGAIIRLRDVARVELEASSYSQESGFDNKNAAILAVYLLPGANALDVASNVRDAMDEIKKNFPDGISYSIPFDMTNYISASIKEVYITLFEALFLVVLVVFLSLQNFRATLVPIIAVPISLIGTFTFMLAFGFSINLLTLLGLILAIGIVVDDAIVVVESVERLMEERGITSKEATHIAMKELSGALIATSLVLVAVFIPVSFLGGISGQLYRQFSITIVISVLLSTLVALTLSPALCVLLLKPRTGEKNKVFKAINRWLDFGQNYYLNKINVLIQKRKRTFIAFGLVCIAIFVLFKSIPSSFIPEEDQGQFTVELELPEGATLQRTAEVTERAVDFILQNPNVQNVQNVTGSSPRVGASQGRATLTVMLKDWSERDGDDGTVDAIMQEINEEFYYYPEVRFYLSKPAVIPGLGSSGGFEMQLQAKGDTSFEELAKAVDTLIYYANQSKELQGISSSLQADVPQLYFDVNKDAAQFQGIPLADVYSSMKAYLGALYVNDFNMFNRIYRVNIQADEAFRRDKDNLNLFFVRANNGSMVPVTAIGDFSYTTGPGSIKRFNMFTAAVVRGEPAYGYSTGQAMTKLEDLVREKLPEGFGMEWSGISYQEKKAGGQIGYIMILVLLFVFLFLAAQYESWSIPISVILSLPLAVFGAVVGIWVVGLENDIYFQIGLVTLIGLSTKNAILIAEVAKQQLELGKGVLEGILYAAKVRFRPIVMTSLAFILGMFPLVVATGPGAASRHSIGTGVFFGMLFSITLGIVAVPFFFYFLYVSKNKSTEQLEG